MKALGATEGECSRCLFRLTATRAVTAADVLARAGDASQITETDGTSWPKNSPTDTFVNAVWLPMARATNQIQR